MNRRHLFKMLGTLAAGIPLWKATKALQLLAEKAPAPGLSVRYVRSYDPVTDRAIVRMDMLHGWAKCYPKSACRIAS